MKNINISKFKIALKFIFGGTTGVIDYVLDVANNFAAQLPSVSKDSIRKYLGYAEKILSLLDRLSLRCLAKWRPSYDLTISAFADLVSALEDLNLTKKEIERVATAFQLAYASWRAE